MLRHAETVTGYGHPALNQSLETDTPNVPPISHPRKILEDGFHFGLAPHYHLAATPQ